MRSGVGRPIGRRRQETLDQRALTAMWDASATAGIVSITVLDRAPANP